MTEHYELGHWRHPRYTTEELISFCRKYQQGMSVIDAARQFLFATEQESAARLTHLAGKTAGLIEAVTKSSDAEDRLHDALSLFDSLPTPPAPMPERFSPPVYAVRAFEMFRAMEVYELVRKDPFLRLVIARAMDEEEEKVFLNHDPTRSTDDAQ